LHSYFVVLRNSGRFFTDAEVQTLDRAGDTFLFSFSELARRHGGGPLWHHIPKLHCMQHLIDDSAIDKANPHYFSCFSDEDLVGQMLRLSRRGHALKVVDHVLDCYVIGAKQRIETC
jgi:hypothetical protein